MRSNFDLYPNIFGSTDYLCHYTNFQSLCSILSTMTLRTSSYQYSNDISEIDSNISCILDGEKIIEIEQYLANKCGYISFSINQRDKTNDIITTVGYLIPSMWGIYADKSKGACLILDKDILLQENAKILSDAEWFDFIDISYKQWQGLKLVSKNETVEEVVKKNYEHIVGIKHDSWNFEQEHRLVGCNLPPTLSLRNGVIHGVVIGRNVSMENKSTLLSILNDENLACYNQIDKNKFVIQEILGGIVYTTDYGVYLNL